jgi:small subunit ribosomal protein S8
MQQNLLADALSAIKNAERVGKKECIIKASKLIKEILKIFQAHGYIGKFEFIHDGRGGKYRVELKGKIVDTNVISPRFSVKLEEFEKWEKRKLPARGVGLLILTTPKGILDHRKAKELHVGGKLLCYVY